MKKKVIIGIVAIVAIAIVFVGLIYFNFYNYNSAKNMFMNGEYYYAFPKFKYLSDKQKNNLYDILLNDLDKSNWISSNEFTYKYDDVECLGHEHAIISGNTLNTFIICNEEPNNRYSNFTYNTNIYLEEYNPEGFYTLNLASNISILVYEDYYILGAASLWTSRDVPQLRYSAFKRVS